MACCDIIVAHPLASFVPCAIDAMPAFGLAACSAEGSPAGANEISVPLVRFKLPLKKFSEGSTVGTGSVARDEADELEEEDVREAERLPTAFDPLYLFGIATGRGFEVRRKGGGGGGGIG